MEGYFVERSDKLEHHGVKGQRWGIRRYQSYETVPRGSGKEGKELGLAKKTAKKNVKAAYNNARKVSLQRADYITKTDALTGDQKKRFIEENKEKYKENDKIFKEAVKELSKADAILGKEKVDRMLNTYEMKNAVIGAVKGTGAYVAGTAIVAAMSGTLILSPGLAVTSTTLGVGASVLKDASLKNEREKKK